MACGAAIAPLSYDLAFQAAFHTSLPPCRLAVPPPYLVIWRGAWAFDATISPWLIPGLEIGACFLTQARQFRVARGHEVSRRGGFRWLQSPFPAAPRHVRKEARLAGSGIAIPLFPPFPAHGKFGHPTPKLRCRNILGARSGTISQYFDIHIYMAKCLPTKGPFVSRGREPPRAWAETFSWAEPCKCEPCSFLPAWPHRRSALTGNQLRSIEISLSEYGSRLSEKRIRPSDDGVMRASHVRRKCQQFKGVQTCARGAYRSARGGPSLRAAVARSLLKSSLGSRVALQGAKLIEFRSTELALHRTTSGTCGRRSTASVQTPPPYSCMKRGHRRGPHRSRGEIVDLWLGEEGFIRVRSMFETLDRIHASQGFLKVELSISGESFRKVQDHRRRMSIKHAILALRPAPDPKALCKAPVSTMLAPQGRP